MKLQFYYRFHLLRCSKDQTLVLESFFGMVRMITNHLLNQFKHLPDSDAYQARITVSEAEQLILRMMNESDYPMFNYLSPDVLKSILVCWCTEWEDFRNKRIRRPVFKSHRDEQTAWLIGAGVLDYQVSRFALKGLPETWFELPESRIMLPKKTTAYLLKRDGYGRYFFVSLHERLCTEVHAAQEETITQWGDRILEIESSTRTKQSRYLGEGFRSREKNKENEYRLIALRKITLHRLLRNQEEKLRIKVA